MEAQRVPKDAQKGPKEAQKGPKGCPEGSQGAQRIPGGPNDWPAPITVRPCMSQFYDTNVSNFTGFTGFAEMFE